MKRVLWFVSVVTVLASCSSLNPDRPCEEPGVGDRRCPANYACVAKKRFPWDQNTTELCVAVAAKTLGEPCTVSDECQGYEERQTVCADQARSCPQDATPNDPRGCNFQCRPTCHGHGECGPDQICYPGGGDIPGVCQEGECGEDAQFCPSGLQCIWFKAGKTGGVCVAPCDILRQQECDRTPPPSDAKCCAPQEACVHFADNPSKATCLGKGTGRINDLCSTTEENNRPSCNEGLFCSDLLPCATGGCEFRCLQYCNRGNGGPVCEQQGSTCQVIPGGSDLQYGFCQ